MVVSEIYVYLLCTRKTEKMKVVRKQFDKNGELISRVVITESATNKYWNNLVERCRNKCTWSNIGIPTMTVWSNKCRLTTRNGHSFEFILIR